MDDGRGRDGVIQGALLLFAVRQYHKDGAGEN